MIIVVFNFLILFLTQEVDIIREHVQRVLSLPIWCNLLPVIISVLAFIIRSSFRQKASNLQLYQYVCSCTCHFVLTAVGSPRGVVETT